MKIGEGLTWLLEYEIYAGKSITLTIGTLIFIVFTLLLTKFGLRFLKKTIVKVTNMEDVGRLNSVFNFVGYFMYILMFFFILSTIGVRIDAFLTTSAALFVGLGFALQKIFQDLIAGIYILLDKTLSVGDIIEIEGEVARVEVIHLRSTIATTRNHRVFVIPNRKFVDDTIRNWTQNSEVVRVKIEVGVYIGTDSQKVKELLLKSVENNSEVLKDPAPLVFLAEFGESSVRFVLNYFIDKAFDNDRIGSDIRFEIDKQFKDNNVQLPVPVLRVEK